MERGVVRGSTTAMAHFWKKKQQKNEEKASGRGSNCQQFSDCYGLPQKNTEKKERTGGRGSCHQQRESMKASNAAICCCLVWPAF